MMRMYSATNKNLQKNLKVYFASSSIQRGDDYFRKNSIRDLVIGDNGSMATVIGSKRYEVLINWSENSNKTIHLHCTCPHFEELNLCKHLWAFILKLDELGLPEKNNLWKIAQVKLGKKSDLKNVKTVEILAKSQTKDSFESHNLYLSVLEPSNINKDETQKLLHWKKTNINLFSPKTLGRGTKRNHEIFVTLSQSKYGEESLFFNFFSAEKNSDESFISPKPLLIPEDGTIDGPDLKFQSLVKKLVSLSVGNSLDYRYRYASRTRSSKFEIETENARRILPELLKTGKLFIRPDHFLQSTHGNDKSLKPATFEKFTLKTIDHDDGFRLSAVVEFKHKDKQGNEDKKYIDIKQIDLIHRPDLFLFQDKFLGYLEITDDEYAWFNELYNADLYIPAEDAEAFIEIICQSEIKFELPKSLNLVDKQIKPTPQVNILTDKTYNNPRYLLDLRLHYGSKVVSYSNYSSKIPSVEDGFLYSRDKKEENQIYRRLPLDLTFSSQFTELPFILGPNLKDFITNTLAVGLPVTVENKNLESSNDFKFTVSSGVDWFDVDAQAGFSGRWVKFPSILEAIQKGENFVPLSDGSLGFITEDITQRLSKLSAFADQRKGQLRFTSAQGLLLNSLLEKEKNLDIDDKFKMLQEKIKSFAGIKPSKPGHDFKGTLRSYQKEGLGWLKFLDGFGLGGILADDMGLGKTIQCLAFLQSRKDQNQKPSILIAPKSVIENWKIEAKKFTPNLKVHIHAGSKRNVSEKLFKQFDVINVTYQTMLKDIQVLKDIEWDCIILDEAQAIKNSGAMISKAAKLLSAEFRLAMTGTPIENSIQDLFSISDFVNPGFLNGKKNSSHLKLSDENKESILRSIKPVILRRTKDHVLKDLPNKTEQIIYVELNPKQLKIYNELKRFYQSQLLSEVEEKGIKKSQIQILAALTRLRQLALHPGLVDASKSKFKSSKFEIVLEMLDELISEGHRILIFSQFTSLLALLKKELKIRKIHYSYLDGKTTHRQNVVNEFKSSDCPVFLMSLKAGGVGLNLVEADYVFLLDPWWNPAVEAQAIDRVHRIGQTRPVNAYRFIAKNTVEEKILDLQKSKRQLSNELFDQKPGSIKSLTVEDIESLFS